MRKNRLIYLILFLLTGMHPLSAQTIKGLPFLRNYSPRDYKATPQNLAISQNKNGIFYFANAAGVLEFNGHNWTLHKIPGNAATTCVLAASDNNVYVGAYNEFGYFERQNTGELKYVSLRPAKQDDIGKIVSIHELGGQMLFQTRKGFYKAQKKEVAFTEAPGPLHIAHFNNGQVYVKIKEKGLYTFNGKAFSPVKNGEAFINSSIYGVIRTEKGLLVATDTELFRSVNDGPFEKVELDFTNFNSVKMLDNRYLGFGLFGDGLVITDLDFNVVYRLNTENGLQDATINDQFLDSEKNLWLALNRGITKAEVFSPVTVFGFNQGIKSSIESIREFKGEIYVSTYNGIHYQNKQNGRFEPVDNLKVDCYALNEFIFNGDTSLYVAANSGIYRIVNHSAQKVINCNPYSLVQSKHYQNRLFTCNDEGFISYVYINGSWIKENIDYKIDWPVLTSCEESDKTVWVSDLNEGVYRLTIQPAFAEKVKLDKFSANGLPKGFVFVYRYNNKTLFGTADGIYEFDSQKNTFFRSEMNPPFKEKFAVHRMSADRKGNLWVSVFYEKIAEYDLCYFDAKEKNWVYQPFQQASNDIIQCMGFDKNFAYFGSASGLFCYDYTTHIQYEKPFNTYIDQFNALSTLQPVFFAADDAPVLTYDKNDLTFQFYSDSYTEENATVYSYYLEGYSKSWSDWSTSNKAFFTNLHENNYTLKVKSKNLFGKESPVTSLEFTILAPWYRTWWAYTLYLILLGTFVYLAILFSTRKLKSVIKERTAEVVHQKEEIEKQALVLEEKNRDILDSIKYAKRIQETIIPSEESLQQTVAKDLFVFYKPKDIVSGDFYWMKQIDDTLLVAVIDCTGHGVPGALVSIVGNNGLNRAVNEFGLREPARILDKLSELTEEAFKQHGKEELRDGMDISLISLKFGDFKFEAKTPEQTSDTTSNIKHQTLNPEPQTSNIELQWSGANNPLWIIQQPGQFLEIKANKQPIGKFEDRQPFTNHVLHLKTGDSVFLFTDGYADQFGGPNGKKFKYKQMQDLLEANNHKSFQELKTIVAESFERWKADYEQIDDVCLMGIRF